jgi:hypothetical protein
LEVSGGGVFGSVQIEERLQEKNMVQLEERVIKDSSVNQPL